MKKIYFLLLVLGISFFSCIKKDALKYDPELAGTWVSNTDSIYNWLIITPEGQGTFAEKSEADVTGEVKYSLFENKMWVGNRKFKIVQWLTGRTEDVSTVKTKEYGTLKDTTYRIDRKMVLKSSVLHGGRTMQFYRVYQ